MSVDVGATSEDSTTIAGVAAVSGPGVAETSSVAVSVAGMGDGVGGSIVGSGGGDVGALHPIKAVAMSRTTKKIGLFAHQ
jgi:hypothetical protein